MNVTTLLIVDKNILYEYLKTSLQSPNKELIICKCNSPTGFTPAFGKVLLETASETGL